MAAYYFRQRTPPINPITDYIQHFSYGARGFMRVPVSEANDLNYWLGAFAPIGQDVRKAWNIYTAFYIHA